MEIVPAIDLREGACSRIFTDKVSPSLYTDDPLEQAIIFRQLGAKRVHITDLDASFCGRLCNLDVLQEIVNYSGLEVQLAGGVRKMEDIDTLIDLGVNYVILGVPVLRDKELTHAAIEKYGSRLVPGVDGRDGMVAIEGFETSVSKSVAVFLNEIQELGIDNVVYTDLRRYGTMKGPNFEAIQDVINACRMHISIAGGISDYDALQRLKDMGVQSAIIGKALYSGAIDLQKAIQLAAS